MKRNIKYLTTVVAVLLITCIAGSAVNGVVDNSSQFTTSQTGSFSSIVPDNIVGNTNSAQGNYYSGGPGSSGSLLDFGFKLEKGFSSSLRLRERSLIHNFLCIPFQNGKSIVLRYTYAKRFFVYALREIII